MAIPFDEARAIVLREMAAAVTGPGSEAVDLSAAEGRVLARDARADRDQPPFDRSTRDGFAVRAADVEGANDAAPKRLAVVAEIAASAHFAGRLESGQAAEIMTGAPVPEGADAVVMVEYTERPSPDAVLIKRAARRGENVVPRGSEIGAGAVALAAGTRLDPAAIALLASLGIARPEVARKPRVAIVATGDELVEVGEQPSPSQIRDSNRHSLAAQVARAGGTVVLAPIARDDPAALATIFREALGGADMLLVSGGVSAGKHDHVEAVLADLGARVVFDGVAMRPGRPLVFGFARGKPLFGLPGNPLATLVTFECFVRPALDVLAGATPTPFRPRLLPLAADLAPKPLPLTVFLPARSEGEGAATTVRPLPFQGSGDLFAMAAADVLVVLPPNTGPLPAGTPVAVLPK